MDVNNIQDHQSNEEDHQSNEEDLYNSIWNMYKEGTKNFCEFCEKYNKIKEPGRNDYCKTDFESLMYKKYYNNYKMRQNDRSIFINLESNTDFHNKKASNIKIENYVFKNDIKKFIKVNNIVDAKFIFTFINDVIEIMNEINQNEALDEMNEEYENWCKNNPAEAMAEKYDYLV